MLLRTRTVLAALAAMALVAALVAGAAFVVVSGEQEAAREAGRQAQAQIWTDTLAVASHGLVDRLELIAADQALLAALDAGDRALASARLDSLRTNADERDVPVRIDVIDQDGNLVVSVPGRGQAQPLVDTPRLTPSSQLGHDWWVGLTPADPAPLVVAVLATDDYHLAGAAPVSPAVAAFAQQHGGDTYLVDLAGRLIDDSARRPWQEIAAQGDLLDRQVLQDIDGTRYAVSTTPVVDFSGQPMGRLVTLRNDTDQQEARRLALQLTVTLTVLLALIAASLLYAYLSARLRPLEELAALVGAMARGNLLLALDPPRERDEVGRIVETMEVFKGQAIDLEQLRFRQARERRRSEALIRERMAALAETLDAAGREALLSDLKAIEAGSAAASGQGRTGETGGTGPLAVAFDRMADRVLAQHQQLRALLDERTRDLATVREALAERDELSRLRQELEIARELQLSLLPATFPPFPDRNDFDIYAAMWPAKEVGGDFYDFFLLDAHRVAVAVGDASDKGVSAAMFIAMARGLVKAGCSRGMSPGETLRFANEVLAADNPRLMFATLALAVLDGRDGRLVLANGGHNPPYLVRAGGLEPVAAVLGPALGVLDDATFAEVELTLGLGETFFLYSDGVTEAAAADLSQFETERLEATLAGLRQAPPRQMVAHVERALHAFTAGAAQADDITMLALKRLGPGAPPGGA